MSGRRSPFWPLTAAVAVVYVTFNHAGPGFEIRAGLHRLAEQWFGSHGAGPFVLVALLVTFMASIAEMTRRLRTERTER